MMQFQVRPESDDEFQQIYKSLISLGYIAIMERPDHGGCDSVIFASQNGAIEHGDIEQGNIDSTIYPLAKCQKVITVALRLLWAKNVNAGMSDRIGCDMARIELGLEPLFLKNNELVRMAAEKQVQAKKDSAIDISSLMKKREDRDTFLPFWMVMKVGSGPVVQHPSQEIAEAEAERLSHKQPGDMFYVLEAKKAYKASTRIFVSFPAVKEEVSI